MLEEKKPEEEVSERIEKSEDKKEIEEEERKKMLSSKEEVSRSEVEKKKKVLEQAVEGAARRRAPTGGIRVPGFLRVSRSRDRNKEGEGDTEEGTDLLESPNTDTKSPEDQPPAQPLQQTTNNKPLLSKINFKSVPFLKRKKEGFYSFESSHKQNSEDINEEEKQPPPAEEQQTEEVPRRPKLINAIKLPLASIIPNKLKSKDEDPGQQAGLASMETLDDSNGSKQEEKMETVKLENVDLDVEKAALENEADSAWSKQNWQQYFKIIKEYRLAVGGVLLFLLLLIILLIYMAVTPRAIVHAPIEHGKYIKAVTSCGHVEGVLEEHIFIFRGIPYVKPPLGPLRFAPPMALTLQDCWNSTFLAHNATLSCWQMFPNGTIDGTEDCLTVDIYTPHVRYDSPLPVVVALGMSELGLFPSIAKSKEVVVVVPRVRQGPFGFLATHHISVASYPHSSGNYGLADLVAALKWINLNAEHFGGDKREITVVAWRSAATLATALTAIPRPEKLFKRLWLSSGSAVFPNVSLSESEQESQEYISALPCNNDPSVECLRKLDVEDLLDALPDWWRPIPRGNLPMGDERRHQWLVQDGIYIRESPYDVWEREERRVDVIIGTTVHSEVNEQWYNERAGFTADNVKKAIGASLIGRLNLTEKVLNLYEPTVAGLAEIVSDISTVCPLFFLAEKIRDARFYIMTQHDETLVYGGQDVEAILGWASSARPEARRAGNALLHLFHKFSSLGEIPPHRAIRIGQDVEPLKEGLPRCEFWRTAGFVPEYAWVD